MKARAEGAAERLGDGPNSGEEELLREITELKLRLEEYASVNASLEERLEVCESENKRLRLENEFLCKQLRNRDYPDDLHKALSSFANNPCCGEKDPEKQKDTADDDEYGGQLLSLSKEEEKMRTSRRSWKLDAETANRLLAALEDAPLHMSYCDSDLRYVWFNHTLKGLTHQEIVGKRDEEIFGKESEGARQLILLKRKAMHTGVTQVGQVTLDWPGDGRVTWMVTCCPHLSESLVDGLHHVAGLSTASIDITEQVEIKKCLTKLRAEMTARKATEDELRTAVQVTEDAIQAKNVFLAIMSHEIRTPLNGLLGLAEALESLELSGEQRELVSAILSSGVIVADILSDILDLASMEFAGLELEERPFDLSEIVQDIMKMAVAATRGKDVVVKSEVLNEFTSRVIGDAVRIRQIIKYLVLNAIKFTERGNVWIRTKVHHSSSQLVQSIPARLQEMGQECTAVPVPSTTCNSSYQQCDHQSQVTLYCEVVDTGVGIPEEAFATLFDKFKQVSEGPTRSFGGTGLGLALCKRLVEFMGGQLHVRSEVGKGSTFAFTVMCKTVCEEGIEQEDDSKAAETSSSGRSKKLGEVESGGGSGPRILLAEDNQVNVMVAISMLKRLGFTAKVVPNGVEALEAIRKDKYDLVLLDICMPLMDGLQVANAIRCFEQTGEWPADLTIINPDQQRNSSSGPQGTQQRLPIVAVTANALRSDVDKYLAHGMDAFIAKPVVFQKLQEILHRYLPSPC